MLARTYSSWTSLQNSIEKVDRIRIIIKYWSFFQNKMMLVYAPIINLSTNSSHGNYKIRFPVANKIMHEVMAVENLVFFCLKFVSKDVSLGVNT